MSAQSFGNYQLVKKLATGGMAEVWLAKQTGIEGFNRHVVVKRILPHLAEDPEFVQMFLNEARIASRFNHPNIGQIYDLGEKDGQYFIAMEFIHGEDLGRVMRRAWSTGQWVARHIALRIVADACAGLYYAHTRNDDQGRPLKVVHRDISPQNILISFDGAVKVLDFGIAKASDQVSNTKSGAIKGKFAYMAPEQAAGKALDARSDVFALGLVLYELVTGVRPLKRDSELATLQAALECAIDPPSAVAEIPPELDGVVMRALAKSPDDRYGDAREFQRALESFLLNSKELSTSAEVSELMAALFADRLNEEARLGTPNPATESSTSNPVASSYSAASAPQQATPGPSAPRAGVRASPALTIDQEDSEVSAPDDGGAVALGGGYELPAGTVLPTRAYSAQKAVRNEETRASMPDVEPVPAQPPRRKTVSRPAAASASDEASPAAAPRRPSQLVQRKTGGGLAMPEAPPRSKSRTANAAAQRPSEVALDKFVDLKGLKEKQNSRLKALVAVILLLAAVGGIVVFRDRILAMLNKTALATDGTPVLLTVTSNPTTEVVVMPGPTAKGRKPVSLGRTPITEQSGAFIGDIVVLKNLDRGLYFEVPVVSKEANPTPNTLIVIDKVFREVGVRVRVNPPLRDAEIYRGELKAGVPNLPLNLMPGVHKLEIRSNQLSDPCPFEVRIQDGSSSIDWKVDVTPCLKKK